MKVYQLRLNDLNMVLEPVFKTKESAIIYMKKYGKRNITIEESILSVGSTHVYRILTSSDEGNELVEKIFSSEILAREFMQKEMLKGKIVKEDLISQNNFKYNLMEV